MAPLASSRAPLELGQLAQVVRRGTRPVPSEVAPTGLHDVDALLGGGLPRRRLSELVGPRSGGRTSFVLAALAAATRRGEAAALVDVAGSLDAGSATAAGVALDRLLWVRGATDMKRAVQAADLILRAGGFGLIILDAGEALPCARSAGAGRGDRQAAPSRVPDSAWLRLAWGAERSAPPGTSLLLVGTARTAGSFAALGLELDRGQPVWDEALPSARSANTLSLSPDGAAPRPRAPRGPSAVPAAPVLCGLASRLRVVRSRRGGEGDAATVRCRLR